MAAVSAAGFGQSFQFLEPGYTQQLFGVTQLPEDADGFATVLGGVAFAPDGDAWSAECLFGDTRLHRFDLQTTRPVINGTETLHAETVVQTQGGCGLTNHPDGTLYSNSAAGVYRLDAETGLPVSWPDGGAGPRGLPGNALGITADPKTGHVIYVGAGCHPTLDPSAATCTIVDLDPLTGLASPFATMNRAEVSFVDGIYFDPTGDYLFMANRSDVSGTHFLTILRRPEASVPFTLLPQLVQSVPSTVEPDGVAFHAGADPFVITNDEGTGTLTKFTFPGNDFSAAPSIVTFASGGFRGDLLQVGADGCIYVTQGRHLLPADPGARYDDGTETSEDSLVRVCAPPGDGFVPGPGVRETTLPPACDAQIGDRVWIDLNRDGLQSAGEPGLAGASLTLQAADGSVIGTALTDAAGHYSLTAPCGGTYSLTVVSAAGYAATITVFGNPDADSNGSPASISLPPASTVDDSIDFGFVPAALGGFAYADLNRNGLRDAGEPGIPGVSITMTGAASGAMPTVADGSYQFTGLTGGGYSVSAPAAAGLLARSTPSPVTVSVAAGGAIENVNFGYVDTAAPVCTIQTYAGPPYRGVMTFQDPGSGIVSLTIVKNVNFSVAMPAFTAPSTAPLAVTATRIDPRKSAQLLVKAVDAFGNAFTCDPVVTTLTKLRQDRGLQTFTDLPHAEHIVTIENDDPGLRGLDVVVNGVTFEVRRLQPREVRIIDVESAMRRGNRNVITLAPRGRKGESATITIADH
jgi:hypothetical protein